MVGFLGRFEYQLDAKGRVSLPAPFRREAGESRFVLLQTEPPALTLYPESTWREVASRLLEFQQRQPGGHRFVLAVTSNAVEVVPDRQGRILIPARLQEAAALDGRVLLVGAINRVEIWNPDAFEEQIREGMERFAEFTSQIFV